MPTLQEINDIIDNNITENTNQDITGTKLNYVLKQIAEFIGDSNGPTAVTSDVDFAQPVLMKRLVAFVAFKPTDQCSIKIGTTNGGNDIATYDDMQPGVWTVMTITYQPNADGNIYIGGINSSTIVLFYIQ